MRSSGGGDSLSLGTAGLRLSCKSLVIFSISTQGDEEAMRTDVVVRHELTEHSHKGTDGQNGIPSISKPLEIQQPLPRHLWRNLLLRRRNRQRSSVTAPKSTCISIPSHSQFPGQYCTYATIPATTLNAHANPTPSTSASLAKITGKHTPPTLPAAATIPSTRPRLRTKC
jgi:hypothetical protein